MAFNQGFNNGNSGKAGGGGGASDVTGLTDTNISSPSNNQVLKYDAATSTWVNAADVDTVVLGSVQTAVNQAAQLALTTQQGDVVVRSDENKSYVHNGGTAGTMADFTLLATPTDAVLSVDSNTGAITAAQLKTSYESNADTNEFSDAEQTKLGNTSGTNTGDQTITLTGDVTGTGTGSFATTIGTNAVDPAMLSATGTASGTTFLRGDNTWATPTDTDTVYTLPSSVVHDTESGALHATDALRISGHTVQLYKGDGSSESVTVPDNNTTYSNATTSSSGLMSNTDKGKLDGVATSANNYTHPTGAGYKHIPTGGATGQILEYSSSGTAVWATPAGGGGASDVDGLSDGYSTPGMASASQPGSSIGIGELCLRGESAASNTYGYNTALGHEALSKTWMGGKYNVTIGFQAHLNSSANWNTVIGYQSGYYNTSGNSNTFVGCNAARNLQSGSNNVAIGDEALHSAYPSASDNNVAVGRRTLKSVYNGRENTALGFQAMYHTSTGINSIAVGYNANPTSNITSYEVTLGNSSISNLRCNDTTISSLSDQRDKAEITNLPDSAGLDFINNLRPVTFHWDRRDWYDDGVTPDGSKIKRDYRSWKTNSGQRMGFIAQEVLEATQPHQFMKDSQVVSTENEDKLEFAPAHLITPLVKAVQQLTARVAELEAKLGA